MMAPTMPVTTLLDWVERGLVLQVGNSTVCTAPGGILWHEYFLDYSDGRLTDQKRVRSREESLASLAQANADSLAECLERGHRAAALEALLEGELDEARGHAERTLALRAQLEAQRAQAYRAVLPGLHRMKEELAAHGGRLRAQVGIREDEAVEPEALEASVLRWLVAVPPGA